MMFGMIPKIRQFWLESHTVPPHVYEQGKLKSATAFTDNGTPNLLCPSSLSLYYNTYTPTYYPPQ
jgi:hypothetical protein